MLFDDFKAAIFRVDGEKFRIHINQVISIERMQEVTIGPQMPPNVIGVTHLRGVIIPVVDLRKAIIKTGDTPKRYHSHSSSKHR